jgi:hypothetical protein
MEYILSKVAKRFYCIRFLVRAGIRDTDVAEAYCLIICSVLECAWHPGLLKKLSINIECVQMRVMKMVCPTVNYCLSLVKMKLERLDTRRENLTKLVFLELKKPNHLLHDMLQPLKQPLINLCSQYPSIIQIAKKSRDGRDMIPYCILKLY